MVKIMNNAYVSYENAKNKYFKIQKEYEEILNEQERLFVKTQPKAIKYDKINVDGGSICNSFDNYLILKESKKIDKRLEEIKIILEERKKFLEIKELELKNSKSWIDIIYVYKYLEKLPVRNIVNIVPYEEAQIYRFLNKIEKDIETIKKQV